MFDLSSTTMGMGIQSVLNNAVQICYRGVMSELINMTLTAVIGGSFEDAMSSFVTGFVLGAGISAIRYFVVGAELVTLTRFYLLSASANFIFSTTMTIFAVMKGYSELAVMFSVMAVLSIAEWCWAYGNYLLIDVYGNNGSATIECDPGGGSESGKSSVIHNDILDSPRTGSALKVDDVSPIYKIDENTGRPLIIKEFPATAQVHGFNDIIDNYAGYTTKTSLENATLY